MDRSGIRRVLRRYGYRIITSRNDEETEMEVPESELQPVETTEPLSPEIQQAIETSNQAQEQEEQVQEEVVPTEPEETPTNT